MNPIHLPGLVCPHDLRTDRQFSMNLARGLEVLRTFTAATPVLGNREIVNRTGLPKATVSRLTYTLTLLGYLDRDMNLQKYRLAAGVLSLSYPLLASMQIRQLAKPFMLTVARTTNCTVNLGIRDRGNVIYIDSVRADEANSHLPDIGSSMPLLKTAIGRSLIFSSTPDEQKAILNFLKLENPKQFQSMADTITSDRKRYITHGYCYSQGDLHEEIHAIAIPIKRPRGEIGLSLNCTIGTHRTQKDKLLSDVLPVLKDAVRQIMRIQGLH